MRRKLVSMLAVSSALLPAGLISLPADAAVAGSTFHACRSGSTLSHISVLSHSCAKGSTLVSGTFNKTKFTNANFTGAYLTGA